MVTCLSFELSKTLERKKINTLKKKHLCLKNHNSKFQKQIDFGLTALQTEKEFSYHTTNSRTTEKLDLMNLDLGLTSYRTVF